MNMTDRTEIVALVTEFNRLQDEVEAAEWALDDSRMDEDVARDRVTKAYDALTIFLAQYPGIVNYDERGNWIGEVRNENGWTP